MYAIDFLMAQRILPRPPFRHGVFKAGCAPQGPAGSVAGKDADRLMQSVRKAIEVQERYHAA